ncbi:hypothetical protein [Prochlorococcus marinus]|uniref:hypothetical protein n=1 Tax=Prochlorococcus marinus TaxID=1219 RepID=UPI0022B3DD79|nr:hypothetical protein [Prochlorococcus marinus]
MIFNSYSILVTFFILIGIPFAFVSYRIIRSNSLANSNNINLVKNNTSLPELDQLLALELISRKDGSGISFDSLIGLWNFFSVWKNVNNKIDYLSSSLLKLFSANLELREASPIEKRRTFDITSSIQFGLLSIKFIGIGYLKGKQPILEFFFKRIELKLGSNMLFSKLLSIPAENNKPFFSLIGMGGDSQWLSARGRGGGLALWLKD